MSNISPSKPSFIFGYWRPWKENSNLFDSYLDYRKDTSLVKYGADTVGKYINEASKEQVNAIKELGIGFEQEMNVISDQITDLGTGVKDVVDVVKDVGTKIKELEKSNNQGLNIISNRLLNINNSLNFINRNLDIQIEQQRISNLLLQNIAELLRVPDSEKDRQLFIEKGLKHFVNASKNPDLYEDSLKQLLKAEQLADDDYFVLHRLGCIYLYVEGFINPEKALDYFARAGKYSSVESDPKAVRLANVLTEKFNVVNTDIYIDTNQIQQLAADSFEKAAFAAYVLGQFENAVNYQKKAMQHLPNTQNCFLLSKYLARIGNSIESVFYLNQAIDENPSLFDVVANCREIDLINDSAVLKLLQEKSEEINNKLEQLILTLEIFPSDKSIELKKQYEEKKNFKSYYLRLKFFSEINKYANEIQEKYSKLKSNIDDVIATINSISFDLLLADVVEELLTDLNNAKSLPYEEMDSVFIEISGKLNDVKKQQKLFDFRDYREKSDQIRIIKLENQIISEIDTLIEEINLITFSTFDSNRVETIKNQLIDAKRSIIEKVPSEATIDIGQDILKKIKLEVNDDKLQIGSKYAGGIVFYLDKSNKHGLVVSENNFGKEIWGNKKKVDAIKKTYLLEEIGAFGNGIFNGQGIENTKKIFNYASIDIKDGFFSKKIVNISTAARLCVESQENGYTDWYLPTEEELFMLFTNLSKAFNKNPKKNWIFNFYGGDYWSSTEKKMNAICVVPNGLNDKPITKFHKKDQPAIVLGVRAF